MTNDEISDIVIQGARYLQAAQQDSDLNLQLTHYNYAVIYFEIAMRHADANRIALITRVNVTQAMEIAQRGQNDVNIEYMRRMQIPLRVPMNR